MGKLVNLLKSKGAIGMINLCALAAVFQTVNSTCAWAQHQPELPEEAKRFKKF